MRIEGLQCDPAEGIVRALEAGSEGRLQFRFPLREAAGELRLEFGDLQAVVLAKPPAAGDAGVCKRLLKTERIQGSTRARPPLDRASAAATCRTCAK